MLDEEEWAAVSPLLTKSLEDVKVYREQFGVTIREAWEKAPGAAALKKYVEFTGFEETNVNALWHHRASMCGPPCESCGKPLRTPKASFCAACGATPT